MTEQEQQDNKIKVLELYRKTDGKLITLSELSDMARRGEIDDNALYPSRSSEDKEKADGWATGSSMKEMVAAMDDIQQKWMTKALWGSADQ